MATTDVTELGVPGMQYHMAEKIVTARRPSGGWVIGNPVEALRPDEVIIANRARMQHQAQAAESKQQYG